MAEPVLLLRLEGPMQSWGTRSRWDVRDTGLDPTKSGVIGLIGCAMGFRRGDPMLEELDKGLLFGVRADRAGLVSTDFHTVTGYHRTAAGKYKCAGNRVVDSLSKAREYDESTVVSPRDYIHDASFLVVLALRPEHRNGDPNLLRGLEASLKSPKWPVYLGRKACVPSRPVLDQLAHEYQDLEDALRNAPLFAPRSPQYKEPNRLEGWIERPDGSYERQDAVQLNRLRYYDFRRCERIEIDATSLRRIT